MSATDSSPRCDVAQTGPKSGCTKFAPRPGCGVCPPVSVMAMQLAFLGVDDHELAARIGRRDEVAMGRVQPAIMQEAFGLDLRGLQVLEVGVVDQQDLAGFLHVDNELRLEVRGQDRGDARFRMVGLLVIDVAAGRDDLLRLQRVAIHDDVLRRPIGPGDRVLVFLALEFRGLDRARLGADLDLGDRAAEVPSTGRS